MTDKLRSELPEDVSLDTLKQLGEEHGVNVSSLFGGEGGLGGLADRAKGLF